MYKVALLLLLAAICMSTMVPHVGPIESRRPLTYKVSLNDPPEVRWAPMARDFKEPIARFMEYLDLLPIPKGFYDGVEWYAKNEFKYQDFVAEIDALAKLANYPFEKIFFFNFMYEFSTFAACTGFLVRGTNGEVMHGRNLDFEMWELLSKLLVNVEYYKDGKRLFAVDTVVGSVFALTGVRFGGFSINVDTRAAKSFEDDLISVIKNNAIPTCWLLRKVLEEETNYASAVQRLKSTRIAAPVYYIIAGVGPNEGMVIERETDGVHAFYELSDQTWFIVQTNYDRDRPEPIYDQRRIPMENRVKAVGNKFTPEIAFSEMFTWPTFNIATIMTAIIIPKTGYHNTTCWYGVNPFPQEPQLSSE